MFIAGAASICSLGYANKEKAAKNVNPRKAEF